MNVAVKPGKNAPAVAYLDELTSLIKAGKWKEAADSFAKFQKDHPTAYFGVIEAVPFRVQNYFVEKIGSTAFSIYSLRHSTWATDIVTAFQGGGAQFETYMVTLDADVTASKVAPK